MTNTGSRAITDPRAPKGSQLQQTTTASYTVVIRLDGISQKVDGEEKNDIVQKVPNEPDQALSHQVHAKPHVAVALWLLVFFSISSWSVWPRV